MLFLLVSEMLEIWNTWFKRDQEFMFQVLCPLLLFCLQEWNHYLKTVDQNPEKKLLEGLDPPFLIPDSHQFQGLRMEFQVKTVNLMLSGTVAHNKGTFFNSMRPLSFWKPPLV